MNCEQPNAQSRPIVTVLGAGSMGSAIVEGLTHAGRSGERAFATSGIRVTNRSSAPRSRPDGVEVFSTEADPEANRRAVEGASIVLIGVKPSMVDALLAEVADAIEPGAVVVSLAAGVTTQAMRAHLPASVAIVRSMANTPVAVGLGMTAIAGADGTNREHIELVRRMFGAVGEVLELDEEKLDAVTALSGSGPAYVYYVIESFVRTAEGMGFSEDEAETLVKATFRGAVELLRASGKSPEQLRREVTSPGGTTEMAIGVLEGAQLSSTFDSAISAAAARSRELSSGR